MKERIGINVPHLFKPVTFLSPTFCHHDGQMIYGLYKQGLKCQSNSCNVTVHYKCRDKIGNLCGIDQKMLSTLISETTSRSNTLESHSRNNNDYVEDEQDYGEMWMLETTKLKSEMGEVDKKYKIGDFLLLKVLGKGSFGKVFLTEKRRSNECYAIKALRKDVVLEDNDMECTMIERRVLALSYNCPFLTHLHSTFQSESYLFFVMEYVNGGDFMFHIQKDKCFNVDRARFYAAEILIGLQFLHEREIIYRDLKLDNILLAQNGHVKIADFGMCKENIFGERKASTFCGTPDYIAPEILKGFKYNASVDYWSYGVLLFEMLVGQSPFHGKEEEDLFHDICNSAPRIPKNLNSQASNLLKLLLIKNPEELLGSPDSTCNIPIRNHPFFEPIDWNKMECLEVRPPYLPAIKNAQDSSYFDTDFTSEKVELTPPDAQFVKTMNQEAFRGFSFTNAQFTK